MPKSISRFPKRVQNFCKSTMTMTSCSSCMTTARINGEMENSSTDGKHAE